MVKYLLVKPGDLLHNCLVVHVDFAHDYDMGVDDSVIVIARGDWLRADCVYPFVLTRHHIIGCQWFSCRELQKVLGL